MSLENAPDDVKLAVDLIMLLESHNIAPDVVLSALEMVRKDYLSKQQNSPDEAKPPSGNLRRRA